MEIFHRVRVELEPRIMNAVDRLIDILTNILTKETEIMLDLTNLTEAVAAETAVDISVETLVTKLAAEIEANKADPIALQALVDTMTANATALAGSVTANTPTYP